MPNWGNFTGCSAVGLDFITLLAATLKLSSSVLGSIMGASIQSAQPTLQSYHLLAACLDAEMQFAAQNLPQATRNASFGSVSSAVQGSWTSAADVLALDFGSSSEMSLPLFW